MFETILRSLSSTAFWFQVLASTTPVLLATLGANIVHQTGLFNLSIEGTMLICALTGVLGSAFSNSLVIGMFCGILSGILISLMLGYFTLNLRGSMNACGVAINLLASGSTVFVLAQITGSKVTSASLESMSFPTIKIPLLEQIPVLGEILSGHNIITYLAWFFAIITWVLLYRTRLGRAIRATGENEEATRSSGINTQRLKFLSLIICGLFASFGGMYLSMGFLRSFTAGMTAGRGYLALALNAMSQGNPLIGIFSSMLYGFSNTTTVYLQMYSKLDLKLISALPYLFIIFVLFIVQLIKRASKSRRKYLLKLNQ